MSMWIGETAERGGVNLQTIRYYEREGLLPSMQELGFTLSEIRELPSLWVDMNPDQAEVRASAEAKVAGNEEKMRALPANKEALQSVTAHCSGHGSTGECPIVESLESGVFQ